MRYRVVSVSALFALTSLVACSGEPIVVPPVSSSPTDTHYSGKFVWHDLVTHDVDAVKRFYGELFEWEFRSLDPATDVYTLIEHEGTPIGGIAFSDRLKEGINDPRWIGYLSVDDVDRAVEQVRVAGGTIHAEARELADRGRMAVVGDPQGAVVALVRTTRGDPPDGEFVYGRLGWNELWAADVPAAVSFYRSLVDYREEAVDSESRGEYHVMRTGDEARAGILRIRWAGVRPNWLPYVIVEDPAAVEARVTSLGGQVLLSYRDVPRGQAAILADPSGAAIGVQKWPLSDEEASGQ